MRPTFMRELKKVSIRLDGFNAEGWDLCSIWDEGYKRRITFKKVIDNATIDMKVWMFKDSPPPTERRISFNLWYRHDGSYEYVEGNHSWKEINELLSNKLKL